VADLLVGRANRISQLLKRKAACLAKLADPVRELCSLRRQGRASDLGINAAIMLVRERA